MFQSLLKKVLLFSVSAVFMMGCHNDSTVPTAPNEMIASSLVASQQISIFKYNGSYSNAALGFEFKIKANGIVSGLGYASPAIGSYTLNLFKVDTVNKSGSLIATLPISIAATDTANFKFKYVYLTSKVSVSKNNYYRVAVNGDFTAYDYLAFPAGSKYALPLPLATDSKVVFTKGVAGYANAYPGTEYTTYMFPADVVLQFP